MEAHAVFWFLFVVLCASQHVRFKLADTDESHKMTRSFPACVANGCTPKEDAKSEVQGPSADQNPNSVEATIESSVGCGATESTCNNNGNSAESSAVTHEGEREKSLEYAEELMARGSKAAKERDYAEATDCYSRALEISSGGGRSIGFYAQKEDVSQEDSNKDGSVKIAVNGESSAASVSNNAEQGGSANCSDDAPENKDVETSMSDYLKALSILERLVEPDSRLIAELVQRLTNEVKNLSAPAETPTASESGLTVQQSSSTTVTGDSLADKEAEIETLTGLCSELEKKLEDLQQLVSNPKSILSDILGMMSAKAKGTEKTAVSVATSSSQMGTADAVGSTSSATVSTAHTNGAASGVTHLGVVGRGVKRVVMSSTVQSSPTKKPTIEPSSNNGDGSTS
ncbi:hypothetical protein DH2020_037605 [Rehmannia glutinosa]|uniref:Uncharacterized protein n=1 Tax=Rehmannia glutinosa TaxID=99300 RepID=A0ABR0V1T6_REHGL